MNANKGPLIRTLVTGHSSLTKSRYTPVVTTLILLMIILGTIYFFRIKREETEFVKYRFHSLEGLATKWQKIFANFEERGDQKYLDSVQSKIYLTDTLLFKKGNTYVKFPVSNSIESLNWKLAFDEFVLLQGDSIVYQTISHGSNINDNLIKKDSVKGELNSIAELKEIAIQGQKYKTFVQPVNISFGNNIYTWYLCGLVTKGHFEAETRRLDIWILLILTTALLLTVIGFPLLKLIFTNEIEQLNRKDVVLTGISVILGAPIVITMFLSGFYYANQYYFKLDSNLAQLSNNIEKRFNNELNRILLQLNDLSANGDKWEIDNLKYYTSFKTIAQTDSEGNLKNVTSFFLNDTKAPGNISNRTYFQAYKERDFWTKHVCIDSVDHNKTCNDSQHSIDYILRPVLSLEENVEESVFIFHDSTPVAATAKLGTVTNPVLPPGYSFTIIDEGGFVWYHSKKGRSTLENLLDESRNHTLLKASIAGNIEATHLINYQSKNHLMYINPIENTPLFLITMYDIEYLRFKVSEILSLGSLAILIAFLVTGALTVITLVRPLHFNLYKYKEFTFQFLTPQKYHRTNYILVSLGFLLLMLISIPYFFIWDGGMTPSEIFTCNLLLMIWGYIIVYQILSKPILKLDINSIIIIFFLITLNLIIGLRPKVLFFQACILVIFLIIILARFIIQKKYLNPKGHFFPFFDFKSNYILFLFIWLVLTAIFPAFNYFIKSRQIENIIWAKHEQLQIVKNLEQKVVEIEKELPYSNKKLLLDKIDSSVYFLADTRFEASEEWFKNASEGKGKNASSAEQDTRDFRRLLWTYRPIYGNLIAETQPLVYLGADNARWNWIEKENTLLFRYSLKLPDYYDVTPHYDKQNIFLFSTIPNVDPLWNRNPSMVLLYFVILLGILYGFYFLIRYFVHSIFGLSYLEELKKNITSNRNSIALNIKTVGDEKENKNVIIIGVPYSGKKFICEELTSNTKNRITLSMLNLEDYLTNDNENKNFDINSLIRKNSSGTVAEWQTFDLFIVEYFEFGYQSIAINAIKLQLLKTLIEHDKKIIIVSDIFPGQILDFYEQEIKKKSDDAALIHAFTSWRYIFGSFLEIINGFKFEGRKVLEQLKEIKKTSTLSKADRKFLFSELGYGNYLPSLTKALVNTSFDGKNINLGQLIISANSLAYGYYQTLWNSLARREKYLVFDLATDGFVNIKNGTALYSLMRKGVVQFNGQPTLFNRSFRNHIMYAIDKEEALEMERNIEKRGSWNTIKIILYLIIIAIVGFLFIGEPTFVEDFSTFLGILAGVATIMPVVSSLLGGKDPA